MKKSLPNGTAVLVLGILSIPTSFCYGLVGLVLGIIALVLAKKDRELYAKDPEGWDNYQNLTAGRTCAIVGVCLGGLFLLFVIGYVIFFASVLLPIFGSAAATGASGV
ncbi:MAG: DUF4190 domain-containing protein [Chitinophagaceae bacterium]|nr:MAG: DUF4190 domain-containing protein [Chitinophagaceae bacterium]